MLKLQKAKSFHGRLKLNNIHIDKSFKIKMNDYGLYNDIYRGFKKKAQSSKLDTVNPDQPADAM